MVIWAVIRLMIGHVEIGFFYYPAVFSIAWMYSNGGSIKKWAIAGIIILLAMNPIYHILIYNEDLSNKDLDKFNYLSLPLSWCKEETNATQMRSDELTKNYYIMSYRTQNFQTLDENDVAFLIKRTEYSSNDYFIINNDLNALNVGNWIQIVPWKVNEHLLENNEKINKILNSEKVFIYAKKMQTNI